MNKTTGIIVGLIALVVIIGGVYASMGSSKDAVMEKKADTIMTNATDTMAEKDSMKKEQGAVAQNGGDEMMKKEVGTASGEGSGMMKTGSYEAYSADKIARAEKGKVVLFFHASWCPSCRGLNTDIESNAKLIPEGVTILKVDYDTQTELKKKYGVTTQHTLVQVDTNGTMIKKWSGGGSLSGLLGQIQ